MTGIFDLIKARVSARQAAEMYGLQFGRNGRALCPWHDDHHPDLRFYDETGTCHCFACGNGGDATALTAQIFGLSMLDAAKRINADFDLRLDVGKPLTGSEISELERRKAEKARALAEERQEYDLFCRMEHAAGAVIDDLVSKAGDQLDKVWDNPKFIEAMKYKARAGYDIDQTVSEKAVRR